MERTLLLLGLFLFINAKVQQVSGKVISAVSEDSANIPLDAACTTKGKLEFLPENSSAVTVATLTDGALIPGPKYGDRIENSSSGILLCGVNDTDSGLYQLTCGFRAPSYIKLEVLNFINISVSEGDPFKGLCRFLTSGEPVESVWLEKNNSVVSKLNISNGKTDYDPEFEGRVSSSSVSKSKGVFLLIFSLNHTQLGDSGDFYCYASTHETKRGNPPVFRLTVHHKTSSSSSPGKPSVHLVWSPESTVVCVVLMLAIAAAGLLAWKLKCCKHRVCRKKRQPGADAESQLMQNHNIPNKERHSDGLLERAGVPENT